MMKHLRVLLDNVRDELREKTDIYFEYDVHKKIGRKIDSFIFHIYRNDKRMLNHTEESTNHDVQMLLNLLVQNGIHRKKAVMLAKKYHPAYLEENVRYVLRINADQDIRNLAGMLISSIEHNYADSPYLSEQYENPFFDMELTSAAGELEALTKSNLATLEEIISTYNSFMVRSGAKTVEELKKIEKRKRFSINRRDSKNTTKAQEREQTAAAVR